MKIIKSEDLISENEAEEDENLPWDHLHVKASFEEKVHRYVTMSLNSKSPEERKEILNELFLLISYTQNSGQDMDHNVWCWGRDFYKQMQDLILIEKYIVSRTPHPSLHKKKSPYDEDYEGPF